MRVHLTIRSRNVKTGPIPVSTSPSTTCPPSCPLIRAACYGTGFHLSIHWRKVDAGERGVPWADFCGAIRDLPPGQLWRHNQVGDLPGTGADIDTAALSQLVKANAGRRGFTFTHKPLTPHNAAAVRKANIDGFTINASCNLPTEVDDVPDGIPAVTILPRNAPKVTHSPAGRRIVTCPAQTVKGTTCASCGLCQIANRNYAIGFRAHGLRAAEAESIALATK